MTAVPPGASEHERNTELLNFELPDRRFRDSSYLQWLYDQNPLGPGYWDAIDSEDGQRVAHYGLIPQTWRDAAGPQPLLFSLNAVTRRGSQRKGYFKKIGDSIYDRAQAAGRKGIIAVPNENSTPAVVKYWKYRFLMQIPVTAVRPLPFRGRQVRSFSVDAAFRASDSFAQLAEGLDEHRADGWTCVYDPTYLRWRLAQPQARYTMHVADDLVAITTRSSFAKVPVCVVLKLLPRPGAPEQLDASRVLAAACRHHHAPGAVYAGFNARVKVTGVRLPLKVRPVPLNLLYKSLSPDVPEATFRLDTYEFLDLDAY
jgi:hypothetical protein